MASGIGIEAKVRILVVVVDEVYDWIEAVLRWMPGRGGFWLRRLLYRGQFNVCGEHLNISTGCIIKNRCNISLGNNVSFGMSNQIYAQGALGDAYLGIGNRCAFNSGVILTADCGGEIKLGDDVIVGPNVVLRASNHQFSDKNLPIREQGHSAGKIVVGDNVWLGANTVILPDIAIGSGAIVGAGSVVTKDVEAFTIVAGVPAKIIGRRD